MDRCCIYCLGSTLFLFCFVRFTVDIVRLKKKKLYSVQYRYIMNKHISHQIMNSATIIKTIFIYELLFPCILIEEKVSTDGGTFGESVGSKSMHHVTFPLATILNTISPVFTAHAFLFVVRPHTFIRRSISIQHSTFAMSQTVAEGTSVHIAISVLKLCAVSNLNKKNRKLP
jgi:hypothetical protein